MAHVCSARVEQHSERCCRSRCSPPRALLRRVTNCPAGSRRNRRQCRRCQIPGAAIPQPVVSASVTGTVTYRERIALPPNALVRVSLQDISRADAPAIVLGEQLTVSRSRQVPIPFALGYDPDAIKPRLSYAVSARITVEGQVRFASTTATLVITRGTPRTWRSSSSRFERPRESVSAGLG